VEEDRHPVEQRQQRPAGQPEAAEHRQGVEDYIRAVEIDPRGKLRAIGEQVALGQQHTLGQSLGA